MRGRKPKPAAVRALHGSRTRPHHRDQLPEDSAEPGNLPRASRELPPPVGLIRAERAYWAQFAPLLAGARVLTPADVETLADYCRACVAVDDRGKKLRKAYLGEMVTDDEGKRRRGPIDQALVRMLDSQLRGWMERKTKLAGELGLTAIARVRVGWTGHAQVPTKPAAPTKPATKLAQLQEQAASLRRPVGVK